MHLADQVRRPREHQVVLQAEVLHVGQQAVDAPQLLRVNCDVQGVDDDVGVAQGCLLEPRELTALVGRDVGVQARGEDHVLPKKATHVVGAPYTETAHPVEDCGNPI